MVRVESKHPQFRRIVGGHFREGPSYSTWRSSGTADWLLIYTVSGSGQFASALTTSVTTAGDAVLIAPDRRHDYRTTPGSPGWELLFAHFHPPTDWLPLLAWPGQRDGLGILHADGEVRTRVTAGLRRSTRMARSPLATAELFAMNALEEALLWLDTQNSQTSRTDDRILRVIEYVDSHLAEKLDVSALATVAALSVSRLSHLFTVHLGISPQRYIERQRLLLAQQLLDFTNRPIGDIARDVGWDDAMYFAHRFRQFSGMSPSAYRRRS